MKNDIKKLPQSEVEILIELDPSEWGEFVNEGTKEFSNLLSIDGFRPGHAPGNLVEQKIGLGKVLERAAELAIRKTYINLIGEKKIEAVGQPEIQVLRIAKDNPFEFKAKVAVMPEVQLGNYRKIAQKSKPKNKEEIKIDEKEIKDALDWLQKSRIKYITVGRPARRGDRVEIDFSAKEDGHLIEGGESKNHPLILGEGRFVPGFEERIEGMKENEEKKFTISFPADFKDLAGKTLDFEVKMNLVQEAQIPELNDDFANSLGSFADLAALRRNVQDGLGLEKEQKEKEIWRTKILEEIVNNSRMELPEILIRTELERMFKEFRASLAEIGLELEVYLANVKKTPAEIKKEWLPKAKERAQAALVLREIARLENIDVPLVEAAEEANRILVHYHDQEIIKKQQIDKEQLVEYTKSKLKNERVFQFLEKL